MANVIMLLTKPFIGDTRVNREVSSLAEVGHNITVLSWNRYATAQVSQAAPSAEIVLIGPKSKERSFFNFILKLPIYWLFCLRISRKKKFEIIHSNDLDTLPLGLFLRFLRGKKLIFDSHESYADMISNDVPGFVSRIVRFIERRLIKRADITIAVNEKVASLIGRDDAIVVMNCPTTSEVPQEKIPHKSAGERPMLTMGYFGSLEPGRFIIEAIEVIQAQDSWRLLIGGNGTLIESVQNAAIKSDRIKYLGELPHSEALRQSMNCDAMLVMFDPANRNNAIGSSNRLFEAIAMGIPPVISNGTYSAEITMQENCGFACDYDIQSFLALLRRLESSQEEIIIKGRNGREAFRKKYNWEEQAIGLIQAYSQLGVEE